MLSMWSALDDHFYRPSRIFDDDFGIKSRHLRDWGCFSRYDNDKFETNVNIQQFKPEEVSVKAAGDTVTIEGNHEEKGDSSYISRQFIGKYRLPHNYDVEKIQSNLNAGGVLNITVPANQKQLGHSGISIRQIDVNERNAQESINAYRNIPIRETNLSERSTLQKTNAEESINVERNIPIRQTNLSERSTHQKTNAEESINVERSIPIRQTNLSERSTLQNTNAEESIHVQRNIPIRQTNLSERSTLQTTNAEESINVHRNIPIRQTNLSERSTLQKTDAEEYMNIQRNIPIRQNNVSESSTLRKTIDMQEKSSMNNNIESTKTDITSTNLTGYEAFPRYDNDKFETNVNIDQFKPEEVTVKAVGDTVTIQGTHEEKDDSSYISRQFIGRYRLPQNYDVEKLQSKFSSSGVLNIIVPAIQKRLGQRDILIKELDVNERRNSQENMEVHRNIPVRQTGINERSTVQKTIDVQEKQIYNTSLHFKNIPIVRTGEPLRQNLTEYVEEKKTTVTNEQNVRDIPITRTGYVTKQNQAQTWEKESIFSF